MRHPTFLLSTPWLAICVALAVPACDSEERPGGDPSSSSSSSSSSSGGAGSSPMTTTPFLTTSGPGDGSESSESSAGGTTGGVGETGFPTPQTTGETDPFDGDEEGEEESVGDSPGIEGCDARCALLDECGYEGSKDCFFECVDAFDPLDKNCIDAVDTRNDCVAALGCEDFALWLDPDNPAPPCAEEQAAAAECGVPQ